MMLMANVIQKLRLRWETRRGSAYAVGWQAFEQGELSQAAAVWTALATNGNASAMYGLGLIASELHGSRDMRQAAMWMQRAADRGLAIAYTALGRMHEIGDPYAQDFREAARQYEVAARAGEPHAQVCLGLLYERGDGVAKDAEEAFRWYAKAADLGDVEALERLGPQRVPNPLHQDPS